MALTPSPETAAEIAEMIVPWVAENYGIRLDYSPDSLRQVDGVLDDLRRDQSFEALQPLLFSFGCYVGEVFVRHASGRWRSTADLGLSEMASSPIVVETADGRGCNTVGKVYKRFQDGPADDLAAYYRVTTKLSPRPPGTSTRRTASRK